MRYHLDASVIPTILDAPILFDDWYNHTVPPFVWHYLLLKNLLEQIQQHIYPSFS